MKRTPIYVRKKRTKKKEKEKENAYINLYFIKTKKFPPKLMFMTSMRKMDYLNLTRLFKSYVISPITFRLIISMLFFSLRIYV